jgi:hypothetical protein
MGRGRLALTGEIGRAFEVQAGHCRALGSPFTAHLCDRLAALLDDSTVLGRRVATWPLDPADSALALRLCGALHRLVRSGQAPGLAALYPPRSDTGAALDEALTAAFAAYGEALAAMLESPPQTNEVARSGVLLGGLLRLAAETGLPLALYEIGASAGLNLHPDCYGYDLGHGRRWGPPAAPVPIACDWRGEGPPLDAALRVVARAGCDLAPVDPGDPAERERMIGYIWPDQPARLARTAAALDHAAAHPVALARAEAADWVAAQLAPPPLPGVTRVLMHSIVWQYFPGDSRDRITAALARVGAGATAARPLAWLRLEPDGTRGSAAVLLTLWPGGATRELGRGDWHGRYAEWREP